MSNTHIIISTHTTRHLRATLLGVAAQQPRPATTMVSIDNDSADVRDLCLACSQEFALPLTLAWRAWPGEVRVGQVRNNGVRALRQAASIPETDWLHFLDGDSVMPPAMLAAATAARAGGDLLIGGRVLLTEAQTGAFDEARFQRGEAPVLITPEQHDDVARRHGRYVWQLRFKHLGLVKMHKPKVLGANHACTMGMFARVNGYDETFLGAWREDDDFGRRVYLAGGKGRVAVQTACVYHLWHPLNPKKRENWSELPGTATGAGGDMTQPKAGLNTPSPQAELQIDQSRAA